MVSAFYTDQYSRNSIKTQALCLGERQKAEVTGGLSGLEMFLMVQGWIWEKISPCPTTCTHTPRLSLHLYLLQLQGDLDNKVCFLTCEIQINTCLTQWIADKDTECLECINFSINGHYYINRCVINEPTETCFPQAQSPVTL